MITEERTALLRYVQFTPAQFMVQTPFSILWHAPRNAAILLIRLYQRTLSPDHGPLRHLWTYGYCRHAPTCSQFAIETLGRSGFVLGSLLTLRRILTCNPWRKPDEARVRMAVERHLRNNQ